jgi:serine protease Do
LTPPGTDMKFKVWRDGKNVEVTVKIGEQPDNLMAMAGRNRSEDQPPRAPQAERPAEALGMRLVSPSQDLVQKYGLDDNSEGAIVTHVAPRSLAAKAGLREGDLITQVGSKRVNGAEEAVSAISKQGANPVRLSVTNAAGSRFVLIEPDQQ